MAYPKEDIKNLTLERAKQLYKRDYWDKCRCDELPNAIRFHVFDVAVNSGNAFGHLQHHRFGYRVYGINGTWVE